MIGFNRIRAFWERRQQKGANVVLLALTAFAIVYFLPHQAKFPYEFQKRQIWQHADFIAPFDLPILKATATLAEERQQILDNHPLYFDSQPAQSDVLYQQLWAEVSRAALTASDSVALAVGLQVIAQQYSKGVIALPNGGHMKAISGVYVHSDAGYVWRPITDFVSKESLQAIAAGLFEGSVFNVGAIVESAVKKHVQPTVLYNAAYTQKRLEQRLAAILPTSGMVQKGEVVARMGQPIDEQTFRQLYSYKMAYEKGQAADRKQTTVVVGQIVLVSVLLLVLMLFFAQSKAFILTDTNQLAFIFFNIIFVFAIGSFIVNINPAYIYITPFPILPIVLRSFFDNRVALFVHMVAMFIVALIAPNSFEFVTLQFVAGMFSVTTVGGLYKRSQIFIAAFQIILVYMVVFLGFSLFKETHTDKATYETLLHFALNGFLCLFAFPLVYIFEKVFGLVSEITLLEMSDTNSPLLRRLSEQAPGTFQHSLQVANLAESAALAIGGKALLVRTGALYHDIGKLTNPMCFTENQVTGVNPHDELSFEESAKLIINHVAEGIAMAKANKLPDTVVDFIRTHHGTTTVQYFYKQYLKSYPDDVEAQEMFRYPGPKPFSKETAILMMADSVEAASRSLAKPDAAGINSLVNGIVEAQLHSGQLENAAITLREIGQVKEILKKKLLNIYHLRVEYPE
ncbi:MAG: HDIG domain-containing protein [Schleiferiaceae bacterium]|nr:HDIG domain-containing protein [Schleiferiaceae bacterium]